MANAALLDTGVLVALVSARDRDHQRCVRFMGDFRGSLVTVEGVLVEAAFLVSRFRDGRSKMLELVKAMGVRRHQVSEPGLSRVGQLVRRYKRMDFVDGLLVAAADELGLETVLTLDRRDFSIYRRQSGAAFEILP